MSITNTFCMPRRKNKDVFEAIAYFKPSTSRELRRTKYDMLVGYRNLGFQNDQLLNISRFLPYVQFRLDVVFYLLAFNKELLKGT